MEDGTVKELMAFLDNGLTACHATQAIKKELLENGFTECSEREVWTLKQGGDYFVVRNDSSIIAFRLPECDASQIKGYHVYAAHSDSPAFKIKENPEIEKEGVYVSINTERYGGMILSTWLDRPLTIAGRACVESAGGIETRPVRLKDNL